MQAKPFSLPDQDNNIHTLEQYLGKWVILYFYPKDDTPGCTKEACSFQANLAEFQKRKVQILGVSKDSIKSHKKFADKFHLTFPLLSDPEAKVIKEYDAWGKKKFMGREFEGILRNTYLINPQGEVKKVFESVNPLTHTKEILQEIDNDQDKLLV